MIYFEVYKYSFIQKKKEFVIWFIKDPVSTASHKDLIDIFNSHTSFWGMLYNHHSLFGTISVS